MRRIIFVILFIMIAACTPATKVAKSNLSSSTCHGHRCNTTTTKQTTTTIQPVTTTTIGGTNLNPPPIDGYFTSTQPAGNFASLPSGTTCTNMVHRSTWEPRPDNYKRNHHLVDPNAVRDSFAARPYDVSWKNWNTLLLPRVDGQFTGTTDEIFQWAACKWGVPDNVLRAQAVNESTWYQYEVYPSGRCVTYFSCGDFFSTTDEAHKTFCDGIAVFGYDYQKDYGSGFCPRTLGIIGVMMWEDPAWGPMLGNQNGTFPFNRDSTAFAVDYEASHLRGCLEGWISYLTPATNDLWGCVGSWYSGAWHDSGANLYITRVQDFLNSHIWLDPTWPTNKPGCDPTYGCPIPDSL